MIVALAGDRYEGRRVLSLTPRSVYERTDFEGRWPLPWTSAQNGDYLIHASGLFLAVQLRFADRYADAASRDWCRAYMAEARASFGPDRFAPTDGYDWSRHFTAAWVPKDYQRAGMEFLYRRMVGLGSGNILADDVGLGKAQPLDARVLTPRGWTLMGRIKVGDRVVGSNGQPTRVVGVFDQGERLVVRVGFNDGSSVECDPDHLWATNCSSRRAHGKPFRVRTTAEIASTLRWGNGQLRHFIPTLSAPIAFRKRMLPIDPYLLGVLLGDGGIKNHSVILTCAEPDILAAVISRLPVGVSVRLASGIDYRLVGPGSGRPNPLIASLRRLDLMGRGSGSKLIPAMYRYSSVEDRLALLRGLMDTDGSVSEDGHVEYCTASPMLARGLVEIVESLGGVVRVAVGRSSYLSRKTGRRVECQDRYRVGVAMPPGICPFLLPRKVARCPDRMKYRPARAIVSVEEVGVKPCRCIAVEAKDRLYITDRFLVTHNTLQAIGLIGRLAAEKLVTRRAPVVVVTSLSLKSQWRDEVERFSNPRLRCIAVDGPRRERIDRLRRPAGIYVVNYEMVRDAQYRPDLDRIAPSLVVLDETKAIANPGSATSREVVDYCQRARWSLSFNATPIENNFGDMFPQIKAADANMLGDAAAFANRYLTFGYGGRVVGFRNEREFRLRIAPVILRRTHRDVGSEIPEVVPMARPCRMGPKQLAAYRAACGDYLNGAPVGAIAMAKVAAVRYAAFAADLNDPASESCKCDDLVAMLTGDLAGERVVVFSCFKRVVEFAARRLAAYRPLIIHSGVSASDRADARRRFNSGLGEGRLIIGTGAMARGMNLQAARVVWSLDLPWNPGAQRQRIGRVARIGQTAASVLSIHSRAQTPSGGPTVDDWFDAVIFPRKRAAMIAGLGDDGVRELGEGAPDPAALAAFLRGLAG